MKKLKVLLTNAPKFNLEEFNKDYNSLGAYSLYPPVQLTTIAAATMKKVSDVEIEILDLEYEILKYFKENNESPLPTRDYMKKIILARTSEFKPDLVGITAVFSSCHSNTFFITNLVKTQNPNVKVVCGGIHATFAYKKMLEECPNLDLIFLYEGDNTFPLYLEYLKGKIKFEDLKGVAWLDKDKHQAKLGPYAPLIHNLDELPIPKWSLIPLKKYQEYGRIGVVKRYGSEKLPSYTLQTVRGCVAACSFCSVRNYYGKGVRAYSTKRVLEEIDYAYNDLGIKQIELLDDDFSFDKDRTIEICNELIKRNYDMQWNLKNGIRLGTINEEVMHALVAAKCRLIAVGVESGNDTTLAIVRKPLSIKMLYEKSEIIRKYPKMYVLGNWIIGFPWEDDEQLMNTFKVAKDVAFDWNSFSLFQPLPGTPEFNKLDKKSQEDFDFDAIEYQPIVQAQAAQKYKNELEYRKTVEERSKSLLMHPEDQENFKKRSSREEKIGKLAYIKNLEINLLENKNLTGRVVDTSVETNKGKYKYKTIVPRNLDRAIHDYDDILKFVQKDHVIAYYCLAKAYSYKGNEKLVQKNMNKVEELLADPKNKEWLEYFDKLVPKEEMNELKNFSNKKIKQLKQSAS